MYVLSFWHFVLCVDVDKGSGDCQKVVAGILRDLGLRPTCALRRFGLRRISHGRDWMDRMIELVIIGTLIILTLVALA